MYMQYTEVREIEIPMNVSQILFFLIIQHLKSSTMHWHKQVGQLLGFCVVDFIATSFDGILNNFTYTDISFTNRVGFFI